MLFVGLDHRKNVMEYGRDVCKCYVNWNGWTVILFDRTDRLKTNQWKRKLQKRLLALPIIVYRETERKGAGSILRLYVDNETKKAGQIRAMPISPDGRETFAAAATFTLSLPWKTSEKKLCSLTDLFTLNKEKRQQQLKATAAATKTTTATTTTNGIDGCNRAIATLGRSESSARRETNGCASNLVAIVPESRTKQQRRQQIKKINK